MENLLKVGDKIELSRSNSRDKAQTGEFVSYVSQVLDMREDGTVVAAMPISEGHIVPIEVGASLEVYFYTFQGIYKANCVLTSRGKEKNLYYCELELTGRLEKFQRREYYRLPSIINADIIPINGEDVLDYSEHHKIPDKNYDDMQSGIIVDISGGGVRMMSDRRFKKSDYVFLRFSIEMNIGVKEMELMGMVVLSVESPNRSNYYDSRIEFVEITSEQREHIVKYIFEQQRKIQKRERG